MASESSLLLKWHPSYQTSASGIPLKMARHLAYQKGGFTLMTYYHELSRSRSNFPAV